MTRMTGPGCVVMCNLINTYIHTYIIQQSMDQPGEVASTTLVVSWIPLSPIAPGKNMVSRERSKSPVPRRQPNPHSPHTTG